MADSDWNALFEGRDGSECEKFILRVRQHGFEKDKAQDDRWTANFAATRIAGPAPRWYESLDDEVQESWKLLRRALLAQYPPLDDPSS